MPDWVTILLSIIGSCIGAGASIGAVFIAQAIKNKNVRRLQRKSPHIHVWNDIIDDIDKRLVDDGIRWVVDLDHINELADNHYIYIHIVGGTYSEIDNCFLCYSTIEAENEEKLKETKARNTSSEFLGILSAKRRIVVPIKCTNKVTGVRCGLYYKTEFNERIKYGIEAVIYNDQHMGISNEYCSKLKRSKEHAKFPESADIDCSDFSKKVFDETIKIKKVADPTNENYKIYSIANTITATVHNGEEIKAKLDKDGKKLYKPDWRENK